MTVSRGPPRLRSPHSSRPPSSSGTTPAPRPACTSRRPILAGTQRCAPLSRVVALLPQPLQSQHADPPGPGGRYEHFTPVKPAGSDYVPDGDQLAGAVHSTRISGHQLLLPRPTFACWPAQPSREATARGSSMRCASTTVDVDNSLTSTTAVGARLFAAPPPLSLQ